MYSSLIFFSPRIDSMPQKWNNYNWLRKSLLICLQIYTQPKGLICQFVHILHSSHTLVKPTNIVFKGKENRYAGKRCYSSGGVSPPSANVLRDEDCRNTMSTSSPFKYRWHYDISTSLCIEYTLYFCSECLYFSLTAAKDKLAVSVFGYRWNP